MSVLVFCNVGARDVMREGQPIAPAREMGARLLQEWPAVAPALSFPIIEPCLRYIAAQHPGAALQVVLFGTDQPDPQHRPSDTLHFAELIARALPDRMPGLQAHPRRIRGINPALYDEAFERIGELLAEWSPRPDTEAVYVILAGGTPACNTALLLQGVRRYGERLRVVYLPIGGEPHELRAGQQVIRAFREAAAVERLAELDFAGALPLLEQLEADPGLRRLVEYAARRFAFDFGAARKALEEAWRDGDPETRTFIEERHLRHDLDPLQSGEGGARLAALLRELYWNAVITYRHRRYADYLGRVYRFQEAVLRYLVETLLGLPTDLSPAVREANRARWEAGIRANPNLLAFLEAQEVEGQPLDWRAIGRLTYKALLRYATDPERGMDAAGRPILPPGEREKIAALLDRINALDPLVEFRHRTIIGHDFEGVSQEAVEERYRGTPLLGGRRRTSVEGLAEIMGMLGIPIRDNPYEAIAEWVIRRLKEGG